MKKHVYLNNIMMIFILGLLALSCKDDNINKTSDSSVYKAKLKLGHIMPTTHPNGIGAEEFVRLVAEKSGGNITISIFPASQLGNEKELFDSVEIGSLDFAMLGFGEPGKKYEAISIIDAPFLANDREHLIRILKSDSVTRIFDEMPNYMGVKLLAPFYYGARYLTTGKNIVTNFATMKGLNIRVPDQKLYIDTLKAMGSVPTPMAFSDVFLSLQQGVIDGQENPLATIHANKFNEVQTYLIRTEHIMGANALYMNTKTFKDMPEEAKNIIIEAALETAEWINAKAFAEEDRFLLELKDLGMTYIEDVDKSEFREATKSVYDEFDQELVQSIKSVK